MKILDKAKIGTSIKINLKLSRDRLNKETIEAISESKKYTITDFKITDGKGIGVVVKLSNGKEQWFFENEIKIIDKDGNMINTNETKEEHNSISEFTNNLNYKTKNKISDLLNPINFLMWLIVSTKDIF